MTDDELDEAILAELRAAKRGFDHGLLSNKTRSSQELADATGEQLSRVRTRAISMKGTGHIQESQATPERWLIP